MMNETALQVVYKAVRRALTANAEMWMGRVSVSTPVHGAEYPYVVYFWAGGGEANEMRRRDANLVLVVKCVSNELSEAMRGAARIDTLLNDQGEYDYGTASNITGSSEWVIYTVTAEEIIFEAEQETANSKPIYHSGAFYRFALASA